MNTPRLSPLHIAPLRTVRPRSTPVLTTALVAMLIASASPAALAQSGQSELSNASALMGEGSVTVLRGSLDTLAASGNIVVRSVEVSGEASVLVLAGASEAGSASIRLSGEAARAMALAAGASVEVVATSTGHLLLASGKVLAFIPNELGRALLHHSPVDASPARLRNGS